MIETNDKGLCVPMSMKDAYRDAAEPVHFFIPDTPEFLSDQEPQQPSGLLARFASRFGA